MRSTKGRCRGPEALLLFDVLVGPHVVCRSKAKVLQSIRLIQRVWRGSVSRSKVNKIRDSAWYMIRQRKGHGAAITIQCAFRR